jgi:hypothetical protein
MDDNWALANGFAGFGAQKTLYSSTIALHMGFQNCNGNFIKADL